MIEWRPVRGFEGCYEVSSHGNVRSVARTCASSGGGRRPLPSVVLKPKLCKSGYLTVNLRRAEAGLNKHALVHLLVADAFLPARPEGAEMRHKDGVRMNCRSDNLEWGTHLENVRDQYRHGTRIASTWHPRAALTAEQVHYIRTSSLPLVVMARELGIGVSTACRVRRGESYAVLTRAELPALLPAK